MNRRTCLLAACVCVVGCLVAAGTAGAQEEFREFPEFRYHSPLPGGGWGVTSEGQPGFDGALQINVPVAYTPYEGFIIGYSSASFDTTPELAFRGQDSNGTAVVALGLGKPGHGIYLCEMGTSEDWESVQSIQVQVVPEAGTWPAVAVGMQDLLGHRDRVAGVNFRHGTESPYLVATKQVGCAENPTYLTLGLGWGRFHSSPFAGVSYRADDSLTVMAEYDGYNVNAGVAYDLSSVLWEDTMIFAGLVDLDRTIVGLTYVYR